MQLLLIGSKLEKIHLPPQRKYVLSVNLVSVLGYPKRVSQPSKGRGGMNVSWNDHYGTCLEIEDTTSWLISYIFFNFFKEYSVISRKY
jgi:hypothetical protein